MKCDNTEKAPFICNGCPNKNKFFYFAEDANNNYQKILGYELFHKIFPIILNDNGKEFKRTDLIEDNDSDVVKTKYSIVIQIVVTKKEQSK